MDLYELKQAIIDHLVSMLDISSTQSREAFIAHASLDKEFVCHINFDLPAMDFFTHIVSNSLAYKTMDNKRDALESILLSSKTRCGKEGRDNADFLIQKLKEYRTNLTEYEELYENLKGLYDLHKETDNWATRHNIEKQIHVLEENQIYLERKAGTFYTAQTDIKHITPFPYVSFTIVNRTGTFKILKGCVIKIQLLPGVLEFAEAKAKILTPIDVWDVQIPSPVMSDICIYDFKPEYPVFFPSDDAITLDMRFSLKAVNGDIFDFEDGSHRMQIIFFTDSEIKAHSEIINI